MDRLDRLARAGEHADDVAAVRMLITAEQYSTLSTPPAGRPKQRSRSSRRFPIPLFVLAVVFVLGGLGYLAVTRHVGGGWASPTVDGIGSDLGCQAIYRISPEGAESAGGSCAVTGVAVYRIAVFANNGQRDEWVAASTAEPGSLVIGDRYAIAVTGGADAPQRAAERLHASVR